MFLEINELSTAARMKTLLRPTNHPEAVSITETVLERALVTYSFRTAGVRLGSSEEIED